MSSNKRGLHSFVYKFAVAFTWSRNDLHFVTPTRDLIQLVQHFLYKYFILRRKMSPPPFDFFVYTVNVLISGILNFVIFINFSKVRNLIYAKLQKNWRLRNKYGISSNKHHRRLFYFKASRCGAYWRVALKRERHLFQRMKNYSHQLSKFCQYLSPTNNK